MLFGLLAKVQYEENLLLKLLLFFLTLTFLNGASIVKKQVFVLNITRQGHVCSAKLYF